MIKPITKYAIMITDPLSIKYHLEKALYMAISGRPGPVWIDIPANIQNHKINIKKLQSFKPEKSFAKKNKKLVSNRIIDKVVNLLNKSIRPIILKVEGKQSCSIDEFLLGNKISVGSILE